ncbi:hypothetical protein [Aquimarina algiphila]|uniref:hypothetical protein n=1 Tax=Aquimarina algiphila TaxID=2047982 RepID=UPI0024926F69|nr:hypothetical protein [Aquimarina algiphila]
MLTLEEQLLFLEEHRDMFTKLLKQFQEQFGEVNKGIFIQQIDHNNFCYDSIISSIQKLQALKKLQNGK